MILLFLVNTVPPSELHMFMKDNYDSEPFKMNHEEKITPMPMSDYTFSIKIVNDSITTSVDVNHSEVSSPIKVDPREVIMKEGETHLLVCECHRSRPPATVLWTRNQQPIPDHLIQV